MIEPVALVVILLRATTRLVSHYTCISLTSVQYPIETTTAMYQYLAKPARQCSWKPFKANLDGAIQDVVDTLHTRLTLKIFSFDFTCLYCQGDSVVLFK